MLIDDFAKGGHCRSLTILAELSGGHWLGGFPIQAQLRRGFDLPVRPFVGLLSCPAPKSPPWLELGMGHLVETMFFPLFSAA